MTTFTEATGNLLEADVDALVNTVNTVGVMGKGIALQFKYAFPENYEAYRRACEQETVRLGEMFVFETGALGQPRWIINFPTKQHWRGRSRLRDIESGLEALGTTIREYQIESVAVPPLGCGNGGLDWADVLPSILTRLDDLDAEVWIYPPGGTPPADQMVIATQRPVLTAGKAALVAMVDRYTAVAPHHRNGMRATSAAGLARLSTCRRPSSPRLRRRRLAARATRSAPPNPTSGPGLTQHLWRRRRRLAARATRSRVEQGGSLTGRGENMTQVSVWGFGVRLVGLVLASLLAAAAVVVTSSPAEAQDSGGEVVVRITAREVADGRIEFGLQEFAGRSWGARLLPRNPYFPAIAAVGRWQVSSPLAVSDGEVVRIAARRDAKGRIEFALQEFSGDSWDARLLPRNRYFPTTAAAGRWLHSSPLTLGAAEATTPADGAELPDTAEDTTEPDSDEPAGPAGEFVAVSAGTWHSCGLRTDGSITCWGDNEFGQADAPFGEFTAVSACASNSCGVRSDGTIICWGDNEFGEADVPGGHFRAVDAGGSHSCGVRADGTVTCWGNNDSGQTDAPAGQFIAVAASGKYSCGVRADGSIICWGINDSDQADAPGGEFTAVSSNNTHSCGLRTDGTIACWGNNSSGQTDAPAGTFSAVTASGEHTCGLRTDGTITCWGNNSSGQTDAPTGQFSTVSAGGEHTCGLRADGTITCWGRSTR